LGIHREKNYTQKIGRAYELYAEASHLYKNEYAINIIRNQFQEGFYSKELIFYLTDKIKQLEKKLSNQSSSIQQDQHPSQLE